MVDTAALQNWSGNIRYSTDRLIEPTSIGELQLAVAASRGLRVLGSRHSFNRIADTSGDLVSLARLPQGVALTGDDRASVGGATTYGRLATVLEGSGRALHNLGSLPHITVAGACSTGTHGSGVGNRCLASAVAAVELVRADGELITFRRGDADFAGTVLALGALGVVTRFELDTQPTFEVRQDVWLDADLDRVLADLDAVMGCGYSVSLFSYLGDPAVVDQVWIKSRTGAPVADASQWGARPASTAQHPIRGADTSAATAQFGEPGPWNARLPHFRLEFTPSNGDEQQSEFFVDRANGAAAIDALRGLSLGSVLQVCEIRTVASDDLWLSPFNGRDTLALHFTWTNDDDLVAAAVGKVQAALAPYDPRPHWAKVFDVEPAELQRHYPQLAAFRRLAAACDPERKLGNAFLERFVYAD